MQDQAHRFEPRLQGAAILLVASPACFVSFILDERVCLVERVLHRVRRRVVADGPLDGIRARSGKVRYVVVVHEKKTMVEGKKPPTATEVEEALRALPEIVACRELPTDDNAHAFELVGPLGSDIRAEIFQLIVQKGWLLLEMRRESQTLEDVFKALTRGDERSDRGRSLVEDDDDDPFAPAAGTKPADEEDDEDDDDDAEDDAAKDGDEEDEADEEDEEDEGDKDKDADDGEDAADDDADDADDEDERPAAKKAKKD